MVGWSEGARLLGHPAAEAVGDTAADMFTEAAFPDTAWCAMARRRAWSGNAARPMSRP